MLHIRSSGFILLITASLYLYFNLYIPISSSSQTLPTTHHSNLCFYLISFFFFVCFNAVFRFHIQYLTFSSWLLSLSLIPSMFIHVSYFYGWIIFNRIYHICLIHSSVKEQIAHLLILTLVNSADHYFLVNSMIPLSEKELSYHHTIIKQIYDL